MMTSGFCGSLMSITWMPSCPSATGLSPLDYAQRLRVEDAKRRLERTEASIDEISWQVGYEDPAFFRRLFTRITSLTPGAYRRRFRVPTVAVSAGGARGAGERGAAGH